MTTSTAAATRGVVRAASAALSRFPAARRVLPSADTAEAHVDPTRWRSVTVLCGGDDLADTAPALADLRRLGDAVEVRRSPAPKDRGVELAVRMHEGRGDDAVWAGEEPTTVIRRVLRETKMLVETGEVLRRDPQPEGQRPDTPAGRVLDRVDASAREEGVL